jgi:hypothetical protein
MARGTRSTWRLGIDELGTVLVGIAYGHSAPVSIHA